MHFQPADGVGVLTFKDVLNITVDVEEIATNDVASDMAVTSVKLGGSVTCNDRVVTGPTASGVM
jgi:hypothetical protein